MTKNNHRQRNCILPSAIVMVFATSQFGCTPTTPSGTQSENSVANSSADQEFFNKDRDCVKFGSTYVHCVVNYPLTQVSVPTNNEFLKSLEIGAPIFLKYSLRCISSFKVYATIGADKHIELPHNSIGTDSTIPLWNPQKLPISIQIFDQGYITSENCDAHIYRAYSDLNVGAIKWYVSMLTDRLLKDVQFKKDIEQAAELPAKFGVILALKDRLLQDNAGTELDLSNAESELKGLRDLQATGAQLSDAQQSRQSQLDGEDGQVVMLKDRILLQKQLATDVNNSLIFQGHCDGDSQASCVTAVQALADSISTNSLPDRTSLSQIDEYLTAKSQALGNEEATLQDRIAALLEKIRSALPQISH